MAILKTPEYLTSSGWYFSTPSIQSKRSIASITGLSAEVSSVSGTTAGQSAGIANRQAKPGGFMKFQNIVIKVVATKEDDLCKWFFTVNPRDGGKSVWTQANENATIFVQDAAATVVMAFEIQECYPTKYTGMEFNVDSQLAYETFELAHNGWIRSK